MQDLAWLEAVMPDGSAPVELARLGAGAALERFPPGWSRPGPGHYAEAEAVLVLEGDLTVSGERYEPGDFGWLPPRHLRTGSRSEEGALLFAWSSGRLHWTRGAPATPADEPATKVRLPGLAGEDDALPGGLGEGLPLHQGPPAALWLVRDVRGPEGAPAHVWSLPDRRWAPFDEAVAEGLGVPWLVVAPTR